jgi:citrate synthase
MNTAAIVSKITYIDGLKGVLRHRGYAIEELAEKSDFLETAYLLVLPPTEKQLIVDLWRTSYKGPRCVVQKGSHVTYLYRR